VAKLLSRFAGNKEMASAVRKVGNIYNARGRPDKAMELWSANVEASPDSIDAMLSQMDIIYAYIDNNDVNDATVDAEVEKLLAKFAKQPKLPQSVHDIGNRYRDKKNYERAIHSYNLVDQKWPRTDFALWARSAIGKTHILGGDDESVHTTIDGLINDFKDHQKMPQVVFQLGEEYYGRGAEAERAKDANDAVVNFGKSITVWKRITEGELSVSLPDTVHAWYFSGYACKRMKEYGKAIEYCQKVMATWPDYQYAWSAQYMIADCATKLGRSGQMPKEEAGALREWAYLGVINNYAGSTVEKHVLRELAGYYVEKEQWGLAIDYYCKLLEKDYGYFDKVYSSMLHCFNELGLTETAAELERVKQEQAKEEEAD